MIRDLYLLGGGLIAVGAALLWRRLSAGRLRAEQVAEHGPARGRLYRSRQAKTGGHRG